MATCLLCSATVGSYEVVCPHCGGAIDDDAHLDPTRGGTQPETTWIPPAPPGQTPHPTGWQAPDPAMPLRPPDPGPGPFGPAGGPFGPDRGPLEPGASGALGAGSHPTGSAPADPGPYGASPYGANPYGASPYGANPYGGNQGQPGGAPYGSGPYGPPGAGGPGAHPYGGPAPVGHGPPGATPYGVPYYLPAMRPPNEGLAIASLATSIAGLALGGACLVPFLACPVGAAMGHIAMRRIEENGKQGRGMAMAGAIVGWIGTAILLAGAIFVAAIAATS